MIKLLLCFMCACTLLEKTSCANELFFSKWRHGNFILSKNKNKVRLKHSNCLCSVFRMLTSKQLSQLVQDNVFLAFFVVVAAFLKTRLFLTKFVLACVYGWCRLSSHNLEFKRALHIVNRTFNHTLTL